MTRRANVSKIIQISAPQSIIALKGRFLITGILQTKTAKPIYVAITFYAKEHLMSLPRTSIDSNVRIQGLTEICLESRSHRHVWRQIVLTSVWRSTIIMPSRTRQIIKEN